jgi:hypothetical protein
MKKTAFALLVYLFFINPSFTQQVVDEPEEARTLIGGIESFGGFLGVGVKAGDINGQAGLLVGGELCGVFSHRMNIGLAGYGLATEVHGDTRDPDGELWKLDMGYGGILLEPVIAHKSIVHLTVPVLLGVGGAGLRDDHYRPVRQGTDQDMDEFDSWEETDVFLVAEPGLNVELNLFKYARLDLGATYRYIYDNNLQGLSDKELSGFTGSVTLKLGWF